VVKVILPFGKSRIQFDVPKENFIGIIEPSHAKVVPNPAAEIRRALDNPIGGEELKKLAGSGKKIAIVVTDYTRACPEDIILPILIDDLQAAGVDLKNIVVVVGTGAHRPMTEEEMQEKFGVLDRVQVLNNEPFNEEKLVYLGKTSTGGPIHINSEVASSDFVIAVGVVEPHQYAGFSGGRKLVAVGAAGIHTITHVHQPKFIDARGTRLCGLEGNPFHQELVEIAGKTNLKFAVNVVLDAGHKLVRCFAGDPTASFEEAAKLACELYVQKVPERADILVLGVGHPKDVDLYQSSRGFTYAYFASKPAVTEGGIIILATPCPEGTGNAAFENLLRRSRTPSEAVKKGKEIGFEAGEQRAYMVAKVLEHAKVVVVGSSIPQKVLQEMFFDSAKTVDEALAKALKIAGKNAKVLVIPHSLLTIPMVG
jgi:nickel-dependent lactate racemase